MFKRLDFSRKLFAFLSAMGIAAVLGACGGGGDDPGNSYPNISYTGVDTEAVINESNAADFPFVAIEGSSSSGDVSDNLPFIATNIDSEPTDGIPHPQNIKRAAGLVNDLIKKNLGNSTNQVVGISDSISGTCGGSASMSANDSGTSVGGTMQFENFCEYDISGELSLHGRITFSASYYMDVDVPVITSFSMDIEYLKFTVSDGSTVVSEEFSGSILITGLDPSSSDPINFEVSVNFKYGGDVFKIANLSMDGDVATSASISGTLYHPQHGYVNIITTDPFEYYAPTDQFCGGSLQVVGSDGAVPTPGTVTLDFTADATCSYYNICIQVNTDPQICAFGVPWGTEPWPTAAIPAPTSPAPAPAPAP